MMTKKDIKVYSSVGCGKCITLKRTLDQKSIEYQPIDDMKELQEVATKFGVTALPIMTYLDDQDQMVMVNGQEAVALGKEW